MDKIVLNKIKSGDQQAFRLLVNQYQHMVFTLCYQICQHQQDAEEASQDTFVKIYLSIKSFEGNAKLSSWIYRIAYNTAISKCRIKKLDKTNKIPDIKDYDLQNQLHQKDSKEIISSALKHLHPNERGLIVMYYLEELSVKEIMDITGITKSNIKVTLFRSRKKLKEILKATYKKELQWMNF